MTGDCMGDLESPPDCAADITSFIATWTPGFVRVRIRKDAISCFEIVIHASSTTLCLPALQGKYVRCSTSSGSTVYGMCGRSHGLCFLETLRRCTFMYVLLTSFEKIRISEYCTDQSLRWFRHVSFVLHDSEKVNAVIVQQPQRVLLIFQPRSNWKLDRNCDALSLKHDSHSKVFLVNLNLNSNTMFTCQCLRPSMLQNASAVWHRIWWVLQSPTQPQRPPATSIPVFVT